MGIRTSGAILLCLTLLCAPLAAEEANLRSQMEHLLQKENLAGAVWSLVDAKGKITIGAAGLKNASTGASLNADDQVHVGSVTKTLVATGVLKLVSDGRLALETPISELLPNVRLDNRWAKSDPVTVRHLLDHTSGLGDARLWQIFSLKAEADTPLPEALPKGTDVLRLRTRPGAQFSYSNVGYALLGSIIESVTGQTYELYLNEHLLEPLGMHDSTFSFVSQASLNAEARLAMGHFENGAPQAAVPTYLRPAMQFTTTARNMAQFSRFLMSDGRIDGRSFMQQSLLQAMGRPFETDAAKAGLQAGYGLGLGRRDRHGVIGRCHGGNTVGFRANLCVFAEHQQAFFIALNADSESADYDAFDALLVNTLGAAPAASTLAAAPMTDFADWNGIYVLAPNRFEQFAWLDLVFNFTRVRWTGTHLRMKSPQADERLLSHERDLLFRANDRATGSHVLMKTPDHERLIGDGFQTLKRVSWWRIAPLWLSAMLGAAGFAYLFFSGLTRLLSKRLTRLQPVLAPFLGICALLVPVPLFLSQSFLQLGDITPASIALAIVTGALPVTMALGLLVHFVRGDRRAIAVLDAFAMIAVLQLTAVMAVWGLVPLRLWT